MALSRVSLEPLFNLPREVIKRMNEIDIGFRLNNQTEIYKFLKAHSIS